ncbi:MAG: TspO/MBR family protein [Ornithinibacter sp.]
MSPGQAAVTVATLVTVLSYAVLSARWVSAEPGWYAMLRKPSWQPPPWVFGVVWPLNFLALGTAGWVIGVSRPIAESGVFLVVLAVSVVLALGWAWSFYVPHHLGSAALFLGGAAVLTWVLVVVAFTAVQWAGWALVPYAVWLSVAASLSVGYWRLAAQPS